MGSGPAEAKQHPLGEQLRPEIRPPTIQALLLPGCVILVKLLSTSAPQFPPPQNDDDVTTLLSRLFLGLKGRLPGKNSCWGLGSSVGVALIILIIRALSRAQLPPGCGCTYGDGRKVSCSLVWHV